MKFYKTNIHTEKFVEVSLAEALMRIRMSSLYYENKTDEHLCRELLTGRIFVDINYFWAAPIKRGAA